MAAVRPPDSERDRSILSAFGEQSAASLYCNFCPPYVKIEPRPLFPLAPLYVKIEPRPLFPLVPFSRSAMNDLTLESLAKRVEALEEVVVTKGPAHTRKDWHECLWPVRRQRIHRQVDEECLRMREAEREVAQRGESAE